MASTSIPAAQPESSTDGKVFRVLTVVVMTRSTSKHPSPELFFFYIAVNIASAAQDESSSEESPTSTVSTVPQKPAVPPRPRSIALEHKRIANVNASLNAKKAPTTNMEMETMIKDGDLDNADRMISLSRFS